MVMTEPERIRGANTRHWDDVKVGDQIDEIARGPLSMSDTMAFVIASGRGAAHGALLKHAAKHPKHYIRNQAMGGGVEYTGIGHHREEFAKHVGVPGMYDYLPQRACWFATAITNWMGDDGVLKRLRMEARLFNIQGDTTFITGKGRQEIREGPLRARRHRNERHQPARRPELAGIRDRHAARARHQRPGYRSTARWSISICRRYART